MASQHKSPVAIVMGSDSDLEAMALCIDTLKEFGIKPVVRILSAHRTPRQAADFARNAGKDGIKVIIAGAGMAAHLAGSLAARTILPVIGVPLAAKDSPAGLDALLSTVQMPPGVPVATVSIGRAGAKNAAILAIQILAIGDPVLARKLVKFKNCQEKSVTAKDSALKRS